MVKKSVAARTSQCECIEPGTAFDPAQWERISEEVEAPLQGGPIVIGREYTLSSYRVNGSWRGQRSGLQILPPPADAPSTPIESAAIRSSSKSPYWRVTAGPSLTTVANVSVAFHSF
jgi:hypothetical protein